MSKALDDLKNAADALEKLLNVKKMPLDALSKLADLKILLRDMQLEVVLQGNPSTESLDKLREMVNSVHNDVIIYSDRKSFKLNLIEKQLQEFIQTFTAPAPAKTNFEELKSSLESWREGFGEYTHTVDDRLALSEMMQLAYKVTGDVNRIIEAIDRGDNKAVANGLNQLHAILNNDTVISKHDSVAKDFNPMVLTNHLKFLDQISVASSHRITSTSSAALVMAKMHVAIPDSSKVENFQQKTEGLVQRMLERANLRNSSNAVEDRVKEAEKPAPPAQVSLRKKAK